MNYHYFIGADISKETIDFTVLKGGAFLLHQKVPNDKKALQGWLKEIMQEHRAGGTKTLFCMEHMGAYANVLLEVLWRKKLAIWLETPLHIKLSLGVQRGKNDKIDSLRIG